MVSSYNSEHEIFESDAVRLREFLKDYKLHAGLRRPFTKLEELKAHYDQSLEALNLGAHIDSDATIYTYDDYAIYHIAKVCADSSDLRRFYHPKLEYLMGIRRGAQNVVHGQPVNVPEAFAQHHEHSQSPASAQKLHDLPP
jgi:DNA-binding PucR family transcriptional regulator